MRIELGGLFDHSAALRPIGLARSHSDAKRGNKVRALLLAACIGGTVAVLWRIGLEPGSGVTDQAGISLSAVSAAGPRPLFPSASIMSPDDRQGTAVAKKSAQLSSLFSGDFHHLLTMQEEGASAGEKLRLAQSVYRDLLVVGAAAVPEILDFLLSGDDVALDSEPGVPFEFQSLRLALIDFLKRFGGTDAERVLLEQLRATRSNAEMEALADALDWLQPGLYRAAVLDVTQARLSEVSLASGSAAFVETAPLFRILQNFGDESTVATLHGVPYWLQAYSQVAMTNLPDGFGIDELTRATRRDLGRSLESRNLHLLAQASVTNPSAERSFFDLVQKGLVPEESWPLIGEILIGDRQLQIEEPALAPMAIGSLRSDNPFAVHTIADRQVQVIYSVNYSAVLSTEEVATRLSLIDRLMDVAPGSTAHTSLWAARDLLTTHY